MPDDLDELQRKIDSINTPASERDETPQEGVGLAMRFGIELVAGVAVGSVFGYWVDRWLGTMPLFFIVCFFLGAAAGFRNILRESKKG